MQLADSLLIWQQSGGEQINFRNINLDMAQSDRKQASIELSTQVNRNQRELQLALKGEMDVTEYPHRLSAKINELSYQLKGADIPPQGLQGNATLLAEWINDTQRFSLNDIALSANESQLNGTLSGKLGNEAELKIDMRSPKLNLDTLMGISADGETQNDPSTQAQLSGRAPVIAQAKESRNEDSPLNAMTASLNLQVDALRWRGMDLNSVRIAASNNHGLMKIETFSGKSGTGDFSLPGSVDIRTAQSIVAIKPELHDIELAPLLKAADIPKPLAVSCH